MKICAGQTLPTGWLWTNSSTDYLVCGNGVGNSNNIWTIQNTAGQSTMDICAGQVLPVGWLWTNSSTNYAVCGDSVGNSNNIWTIRNTTISCSLSSNTSLVPAGGSFIFNVSLINAPQGSLGYWYGTKNGVVDTSAAYFGPAPGTYTYYNSPGSQGTYGRQAQLRNAQGQTLCTTNMVYVELQPTPTCTLSIDKTYVPLGGTYTFSVSGNNLPAGSQAYWYGSKNGTTDISGSYMGPVPSSVSYQTQAGWSGTYTRWLEIRNGSTPVCQTSAVTVTLQ